MSQDILNQLVQFVKDASPKVWAAAQHQVFAQVVNDVVQIILALILLVASIVGVVKFVKLIRWGLQGKGTSLTDNREGWQIIGGVGIAISLILALVALACISTIVSDLIQKLLAPDYATIQVLADLIKR